ncbi:MAG: transcription antitermination factor NusB [Firmicutes bacterium]|nr:transcription antitermination factor NusB [Bacillota bacterium]
MTRNEAREILMQILYEMDADGEMTGERARLLAADRLAGGHVERGGNLLAETVDHLEEIDGDINRCSTRWKTSRMPRVDLAIMRLACGEMRFAGDIPDAVAINEALNLAKKFSTPNSAKFIHGVLGAIAKTSGEVQSEEE